MVNNPERGILRVTVNGDWTNAGTISAGVTVFSTTDPIPQFTSQGKIVQGQTAATPIVVPAGTAQADFRLAWREDWGNYPTNDIDLILISPSGAVNFAGATLRNPELVSIAIANPAPGSWTALILGFEVPAPDMYELHASLDGNVVR